MLSDAYREHPNRFGDGLRAMLQTDGSLEAEAASVELARTLILITRYLTQK